MQQHSNVPLLKQDSTIEKDTNHLVQKTKTDNSGHEVKIIMLLKSRRQYLFVVASVAVLTLIGVIILAVGVYKYTASTPDCPTNYDRINLGKILHQTKDDYYRLYPHEVYENPDLEEQKYVNNFVPYDPSWKTIKLRTDHALKLRKDLRDYDIKTSNLRPREKKAYAQLEHYLDSIFGNPYNENYYAGDWMMGPDYFCWQSMCYVAQSLRYHFNPEDGFIPTKIADVEKIIETIKKMKDSYGVYRENIVRGVQAGMVRSVEDCQAGLDSFTNKYPNIVDQGAKGVLKESFSTYLLHPAYYTMLNQTDKDQFKQKNNGKNITEKMSDVLLDYLGKPLHEFIEFLKTNHSRHCVPSSVSSGLANLPLKRVWLDQKETDIETTQKLPTGETLSGPKSYEMILPYFTTTRQYNARSIYELGEKQREKLYRRAQQIARKLMNKDINHTMEAVDEFKEDLNHPRHFFNTTTIPGNENGAIGGSRCKNMEMARKNCPVRYEAMQLWFAYAQQLMAKLDPLTVDMFYMGGPRLTTPICPVKMIAKFNPSSGSQSYSGGGMNCKRASHYKLPFFLKLPGPKYNAFSVAGHETRPGHHTQVQGFNEHFSSSGNNDVIDWLNTITYYTAFTEGWALYAENPLLATETTLYKDEPLQEYGMLKWQIWRALRLVIDTGLHSRGMDMHRALELFEMFAWDTTDKSYKDTIRYMSDPGQATAYMIGQLAIWTIRNETENVLRENGIIFDEKEFHYQILSQGSSPIDYLRSYMKEYQKCKIDTKASPDCAEVLEPKQASQSEGKFRTIGTKERWEKFRNIQTQRREHHE
eukprot:TCONS_00050225-protein